MDTGTVEIMDQIAIVLLGVGSIFFYTHKNIVWGASFGLAAEPFWFYSAYTTEQWGIFISAIMYTMLFVYGLWKGLSIPTKVIVGDKEGTLTPQAEYIFNLSKCPNCGGPADNGNDREVPPNPYYCTKCDTRAKRWFYDDLPRG